MDAISQLLTRLSVDPFRFEAFKRDPHPFIAEAGIAPEDVPRLLRPSETLSEDAWVRCAICNDPGYDPLPDPEVPEAEDSDADTSDAEADAPADSTPPTSEE
jgi:hypothetical protein